MKNFFKKEKVEIEVNGAKLMVPERVKKILDKEEKKNKKEAEFNALPPEEQKKVRTTNALKVVGIGAAVGLAAGEVGKLLLSRKSKTQEETTVSDVPFDENTTYTDLTENSDNDNQDISE